MLCRIIRELLCKWLGIYCETDDFILDSNVNEIVDEYGDTLIY